jgi:hypothetical protein
MQWMTIYCSCMITSMNFIFICGFVLSGAGIATGYRLDGLGIESRSCPDQSWGPPSLLYTGYRVVTVSVLGVNRPECGADHPPPSSAEATNE